MSAEYILTVITVILLALVIRSTLHDARREREKDEMKKHLRRIE